MRALLIILALSMAMPAYSMRCSGKLVGIGDSYYKLTKNCDVKSEYVVNNAISDQRKVYVSSNGADYEFIVIDGNIRQINRL